jgi:hypothetical protein
MARTSHVDRPATKHNDAAAANQRRHVSIRVSLSGSDDTTAEAGAACGSRPRTELISLVNKLLGHSESAPDRQQVRSGTQTLPPVKGCQSLPWVRDLSFLHKICACHTIHHTVHGFAEDHVARQPQQTFHSSTRCSLMMSRMDMCECRPCTRTCTEAAATDQQSAGIQ